MNFVVYKVEVSLAVNVNLNCIVGREGALMRGCMRLSISQSGEYQFFPRSPHGNPFVNNPLDIAGEVQNWMFVKSLCIDC